MFLGYMHAFRALAITYIVAGHVIDAFIWANPNIENLLRIFLGNGSVLFVFIAGYLFQHLSVRFNARKYYESKLKNVITPYLLVSIPAIVIFVTVLERESMWSGFYDHSIWEQIGLFYLTGYHLAPLWFIPMIALFFIIAPLLVKADRSGYIYYTLPVLIIISCFVSRGLPHENFVHFFSVFVAGMFCSRYKESINPVISRYSVIALSLAVGLAFAAMEFFLMEHTMTYLNYLQKMAMSVLFLGLFIKYEDQLNYKPIAIVAGVSFGIFFVHSYFITAGKIIYSKLAGDLPEGSLISFTLLTIVVLLVCTLLIMLIQKIFSKNSRYLVGS